MQPGTMHDLPIYISVTFGVAVFTCLAFFIASTTHKLRTILLLSVWMTITAILAAKSFFLDLEAIPPRIMLVVLPSFIVIGYLFISLTGRRFLDKLDLKMLTLLSIIRIPVELVLYWLFLQKAVPELMTFAGRNFDILAGITAPVIWFLCFKGKTVTHKRLWIGWHIISLLLLLNIVIHAILSAPSPFQQLAFDQPNIAIFYFPYIWLPTIVVPLVFLSHLASIRKGFK